MFGLQFTHLVFLIVHAETYFVSSSLFQEEEQDCSILSLYAMDWSWVGLDCSIWVSSWDGAIHLVASDWPGDTPCPRSATSSRWSPSGSAGQLRRAAANQCRGRCPPPCLVTGSPPVHSASPRPPLCRRFQPRLSSGNPFNQTAASGVGGAPPIFGHS